MTSLSGSVRVMGKDGDKKEGEDRKEMDSGFSLTVQNTAISRRYSARV